MSDDLKNTSAHSDPNYVQKYVPEETGRPKSEAQPISAQASRGLVVMLHGFDLWDNDNPGKDYKPDINEMCSFFERHNFTFRAWDYNTHASFVDGAKFIESCIRGGNFNLNNLHLFGYSMGGLVARQVVANGLVPQSLTTFCTPHLGIVPWMPTPNYGAMSMHAGSQDLKNLNANSRDKACRGRYTFMGLNYYDNFGDKKDDDGMCYGSSSTMFKGNPPPGKYHYWTSIRKAVGGGFAGSEVHGGAQKLDEIRPALGVFTRNVLGPNDYPY